MDTPQFGHELAQLRREIDAIDAQLMMVLARRSNVSSAIGRLKHTQGLPIYDADREQALINERASQGVQSGLPQRWTADLFGLILAGCRSISSVQLDNDVAMAPDQRCA